MIYRFVLLSIMLSLLAGCASQEDASAVNIRDAVVETELSQAGYDENSWERLIPKTCQEFYDGCNFCRRSGRSVACIRRSCSKYERPECLDRVSGAAAIDDMISRDQAQAEPDDVTDEDPPQPLSNEAATAPTAKTESGVVEPPPAPVSVDQLPAMGAARINVDESVATKPVQPLSNREPGVPTDVILPKTIKYLCAENERFAVSLHAYILEDQKLLLSDEQAVLRDYQTRRAELLLREPSASGSKYASQSLTYWSKGEEASLEKDGKVLYKGCREVADW